MFVDETGDLGPMGTRVFGYGIFEVHEADYGRIREILAEERWRRRLYRSFELSPDTVPIANILTQLGEFKVDPISWTGLGRY